MIEVDELTRYAARQEALRFMDYCRQRRELHNPPEPKRTPQMGRPVTDRTKEIIAWIASQDGVTTNEIAERYSISRQAVHRLCARQKGTIVCAGKVGKGKLAKKLWKVVQS